MEGKLRARSAYRRRTLTKKQQTKKTSIVCWRCSFFPRCVLLGKRDKSQDQLQTCSARCRGPSSRPKERAPLRNDSIKAHFFSFFPVKETSIRHSQRKRDFRKKRKKEKQPDEVSELIGPKEKWRLTVIRVRATGRSLLICPLSLGVTRCCVRTYSDRCVAWHVWCSRRRRWGGQAPLLLEHKADGEMVLGRRQASTRAMAAPPR